ncbi:sigma-54-dependent Fis family transcriptional regulator [Oceanidesulfovibrio indonesiensis]|uniref:Sigma-54-dependent Fis family transcriptional regulator n=1 Tax=Oceanidesulfovibrio indonesiensis TaxID=54767 RepID=A0A7M3MGP1_9BACT|nr:sigma 54-interacting transcriptional regulator [Oceanidesulfovibrio indonesiensis]TVM17923.1 sigma-54-dependent Fis family transcriptional regulator [Oceanidesulfovibrio indonesiensis]
MEFDPNIDITGSEEFLRTLYDTITEGLLVVDLKGRIRMANPAMERLTGYRLEELVGRACSVLRCDVCEVSRKEGRDHWCRLFDKGLEMRKQCTIIRKDGGCVPVLKNASLLRDGDRVIGAVETLTDISEIVQRDETIRQLSQKLSASAGFHGLIGRSPAMLKLFRALERTAQSDAPVIIYGESGTGKELAARAIHELSPRRHGPYIQLNCAAINEALFESELFGHVKGAFTGAIRHRQGRFEAAHGGDLFLDEIGDVPQSIQVKLLRVLETQHIERVGDHKPIEVDVRFIAATNRDLSKLVADGEYREDFFYRINVLPVHIPPLRARKEDIPLLCDHFLQQSRLPGDTGLAPEAMNVILAYDWPGNVRELRSALEFARTHAGTGLIRVEHLPPHVTMSERNSVDRSLHGNAVADRPVAPNPLTTGEGMDAEKFELLDALRKAGGNKSEAARILGVHRGTVLNRMRKHGVDLTRTVIS